MAKLILFGCSENDTSEPKDKLLVGAIGTPTTDYYNFESLDYEQLSDEKLMENYNAVFIFPSATAEIMKDIDKRRILRNIAPPLVMIDQKDLVIGQLVQSSASNFSEYGNANGDIQFTYVLRGSDNEKNYYNTTLIRII